MKETKNDVRNSAEPAKCLMDIADGFISRFINHHMETLREFAKQGEALAEEEAE